MEKIKQKNTHLDYEIIRVVATPCEYFKFFEYDECVAVVAKSDARKSILLSYRGTKMKKQLVDEIASILTVPKQSFHGNGHVQAYFLNAASQLTPCVRETTRELQAQYPGYDVWLSGHSLGGAMASVSSLALVRDGVVQKDKMSLYTYGMPRVGDKDYALQHDKQINNSFRIVHYKDCVTHLPTCNPLLGFSCTLGGKTSPFHHRSEIFYRSLMAPESQDWEECRANEDPRCSHSVLGFIDTATGIFKLPSDCNTYHQNYFNIRVGDYCNDLLGKRRRREVSDMSHLLKNGSCKVLRLVNGTWTSSFTANVSSVAPFSTRSYVSPTPSTNAQEKGKTTDKNKANSASTSLETSKYFILIIAFVFRKVIS